jgi:hypothetical protein
MSAEEEVDVLLDAELQDDHQLASVVDVPLEERVDASLLRLIGGLPQAGQDRGALDRREVGATVVGMIEEWCQACEDIVPGALSTGARPPGGGSIRKGYRIMMIKGPGP